MIIFFIKIFETLIINSINQHRVSQQITYLIFQTVGVSSFRYKTAHRCRHISASLSILCSLYLFDYLEARQAYIRASAFRVGRGKRQPLLAPHARVVNTEECETGLAVTGSGAKSPRNFLNVLAKCSNPLRLIHIPAGITYVHTSFYAPYVFVYANTLRDKGVRSHVERLKEVG